MSQRVAILAIPETTASVLYGMYDLFLSAGRDWQLAVDGTPGPQLITPIIAAARPDAMQVANGVQVIPHCAFDAVSDAGLVCVPEANVPPGLPLAGRYDAEVAWLRRRYDEGATIATACSGALLLAEGGLLRGEQATTHWAYADTLRTRYSDIRVHTQRAMVIAGEGQRLVMAGGGTSWLDLTLYLIARLAGTEVAMQTARVNLVEWHTIGQQPFACLARKSQVADAVIARCQGWIAAHYDEPTPVASMVRLSGLAERSFKRRFQLATGMSPLEYVHTLRLEEAKQMLEAGTETIEAIANAVGYGDAAFFTRLFRRRVALTPAQYRRRFGAMRRSLGAGAAVSAGAISRGRS